MGKLKAVCFDLYGTLIRIETDEGMEEIYRGLAHFLTYQGIHLHRGQVRDAYWEILKAQKAASKEKHPEIDVLAIWEIFLERRGLSAGAARKRLALALAQLFRGLSRKQLSLFPGVAEGLKALSGRCALGLVSDAQPCWALPEMEAMGIGGVFGARRISGPFGFRKPDPRMFLPVLKKLGVRPEEAVYVGNDMYRDVLGARNAGMAAIFFATGQGAQEHPGTEPDYRAYSFGEVLRGIEFLSER